MKSTPDIHAPDRSHPPKVAPSHRARLRSASRSLTPWNVVPLSFAPDIPTNDQLPPSTSIRSNAQPSNTLPVSLQRANDASKKLQRLKVQLMNALSVCFDTLNRTLREGAVGEHGRRAGELGHVDVEERDLRVFVAIEVAPVPVRAPDRRLAEGVHPPIQSRSRAQGCSRYRAPHSGNNPVLGERQSWFEKAASKDAVGSFQSSERM